MILCSMKTVLKFRRILHSRSFASGQNNVKKGIVLGVYESDGGVTLTPTAQSVNTSSNGRLENLIALAGPVIKRGKAHVFYDVIPEATAVAVVGLGKQNVGLNESEEIHEGKEAVRGAAAIGSNALKNVDIKDIAVEDMCDAQSAAEGAIIGTWTFNEYKMKKDVPPNIQLYGAKQKGEWERGVALAEAQNLARRLMEMPSNLLTPTIFAQNTEEALTKHGVEVIARNKKWAEQMKMGAFLSVTQGSSEPPVFLEITYCNGPKDQKPIAFVGKGVTFDTGGISLKPAKDMPKMRGDMGGAACVVSAIQAAAKLKLSVNVKGFIPLCENMPSGEATKPGDIVTAMNGKKIQVDNTDAEGRLILADALCYASQFNPLFTLDIATLTGAMDVALGGAATGVFSNSTPLWRELQKAGMVTGDRMWRFPLWDCYNKSMTEQSRVDVNNIGPENGGGSCKAAAFLKEFAPKENWMHLDIAGVAFRANGIKYLIEGMTGRPTRTLVQLLEQHAA